jgi:hypothetical protein
MKQNNNGLYVGMKLYNWDEKEFTVKKIARKYFEVEETWHKIEIATLKYTNPDYMQANYQLYRDKNEILHTKERRKLIDQLRKAFSYYGDIDYTLEQLRQVAEILNLNNQ